MKREGQSVIKDADLFFFLKLKRVKGQKSCRHSTAKPIEQQPRQKGKEKKEKTSQTIVPFLLFYSILSLFALTWSGE